MKKRCPYCPEPPGKTSGSRKLYCKAGRYYRKDDSRIIQRYRCRRCRRRFSSATFHPCVGQKKRTKNFKIAKRLCSTESQNDIARNECVNRKTVARKVIFMAGQARVGQAKRLGQIPKPVVEMEFDDMETFERTKCLPIAITVAVAQGSRFILDLKASQIPCKGPLAEISRTKYGERVDFRPKGRAELFQKIQPYVSADALIKSDQDPQYPGAVKRFFPSATHRRYKGRKPQPNGYGELKKGGFDPLFSINHTAAMVRYKLHCMSRKTWCTTKLLDRLQDRLDIYTDWHNWKLELADTPKRRRRRRFRLNRRPLGGPR